MNKRIYLLVLIILSFIVISCNNVDHIQYSDSSSISGSCNESSATIECLRVNDISPIENNITFDEAIIYIGETIDVDIFSHIENNNYDFEENNHRISYIEDYYSYLKDEFAINYLGQTYYPFFVERCNHTVDALIIDGVIIVRYENSEYSKDYYQQYVFDVIDSGYLSIDYDYTNGYFFLDYSTSPQSRQFEAHYLCGDYTVSYSYSFNDNDVNEYLNYLELMDTLGLPTCDEMTDIVLG